MGRKRNEALKAALISWGVVQNLGVLALGNAADKSLDLRCCGFLCSWAPPTCLSFGDAVPGLLGRLLVWGGGVRGGGGVGPRVQAGRFHCLKWGMRIQRGVPPLGLWRSEPWALLIPEFSETVCTRGVLSLCGGMESLAQGPAALASVCWETPSARLLEAAGGIQVGSRVFCRQASTPLNQIGWSRQASTACPLYKSILLF